MSKIITYDLCNEGKNYTDLIAAIKKLSNVAKLTESCWITDSSNTCTDIRDSLTKYLDDDDRIFVGELTGTGAWRNLISSSDKVKAVL